MTVREGDVWRAGRFVRTVLAITRTRVCVRLADGEQHWMTIGGFETWAKRANRTTAGG